MDRSEQGSQTPGKDRPLVLVVGARGIPDVEGGAEKNAEMIFPRIAAAGYRVILMGLDGHIKSDDYRGVELRRAANVRILNTDKILYYLTAVRLALRLRPDIVHLQGLGSSIFLLIYKAIGIRTVVRYGSADYIVAKWGFIGRLGFRLAEYQMRFADAIIAVAPALARRLADHKIEKNVYIIANAVDDVPEPADIPPPVAGQDDGAFILFVGRVTAQKNVLPLVKAFSLIKKSSERPLKLLIAGGLEDKDYVQEVQPLLTPDIVLLDRCTRHRLEGLYRRCTVFVNASMHEGSSNAVLEAISRNCPIVLSDIPENRDFGLAPIAYFDPADEAAMARTMEACVAAPDQYRVDRTRYLDWAQVAAKTVDIYRSILA